MDGPEESLAKIFSGIHKEELTRLAMDPVDIPSPTGQEGKIAQFIVKGLWGNGIEPKLQEVEEGRYNAVGRLRGSGNGLSLTIHAHLDTAFSGVEADLPVLGEIRLGATEAAMKTLEVKAETVRMIIEDVPKSNWAIAGEWVSNRGEP